jgi:hypothetical protein
MQVVTAQERMKVSHALQQEAACMAVMLSNACMVHKLVRRLIACGSGVFSQHQQQLGT